MAKTAQGRWVRASDGKAAWQLPDGRLVRKDARGKSRVVIGIQAVALLAGTSGSVAPKSGSQPALPRAWARRSTRFVAASVALVLVAGATVGSLWRFTDVFSSSSDSPLAVVNASQATLATSTVRVAMTVEQTSGASTFVLDGKTHLIPGNRTRLNATIQWNGVAHEFSTAVSGDLASASPSASMQPVKPSGQIIGVGGTVFVDFAPLMGGGTPPWVALTDGGASLGARSGPNCLASPFTVLLDPSFLDSLTPTSAHFSDIGSERIGGAATTHDQLLLDAAELPRSIDVLGCISALAHENPSRVATVPVDVWIDTQGRIVQERLAVDASASPSGTDPQVTLDVTMSFSHFGDDVSVSAPSPSDVAPLTNIGPPPTLG